MQEERDDLFGHIVVRTRNRWVYEDDRQPVDQSNLRSCKSCKVAIERGCHDPCIANLPETRQACCGHGLERNPRNNLAGYVALNDGRRIRFSGAKFDGPAIRAMVESVLREEPLPEGAEFDAPMWWQGLTDAQYQYVWQRLRHADDIPGLVEEARALA